MKKKYYAHPSAFIDAGVNIGVETQIWHCSHIFKGAHIGKKCKIGQNVVIHGSVVVGDNVKIQNNVSVYDGVILENDVFCGPSMVFTNIINPRSAYPRNTSDSYMKTLVKEGASIGANATIICGNTIGKYAFVGAGSVVTKDVPDYALVFGSPAGIKGWMCRCGEKLHFKKNIAHCKICEKSFVLKNRIKCEETK
ncbi:MAG: N-acetyltransferase [Candidatus Omnitrophica bacterium]|nr:N-acetyltransferase [Candidatus Omnitrophota bacterium]